MLKLCEDVNEAIFATVTQPGYPQLEYLIEHLATLTRLATGCSTIAEFGSCEGLSAVTFLRTKPRKFISVDVIHSTFMKKLPRLGLHTEIVLLTVNTLNMSLEPVDLLFIDSWHRYIQLKSELDRHHSKVLRYLVVHDTTAYEFHDERNFYNLPEMSGQKQGLWIAIREFLEEHRDWEIAERYVNCCGLTVLRKSL